MSPRWLGALVRARTVQEDVARQQFAYARRSAGAAHDRVARQSAHLADMRETAGTQGTATAFVAAAIAMHSVAATHSALVFAAAQADEAARSQAEHLQDSAVARSAAEKLLEHADAADLERAARSTQVELDEIAARVSRAASEAYS